MYSTALRKFSIVRGGFFYRLQERLNLVNENDSRLVVRAVIFAIVSWVPLLILAAFQSLMISENPQRSLLLDFTTYGRFLVAAPILIAAENLVDDRYVVITSYFFNSGVVPETEIPKYKKLLEFVQHLVYSNAAEIALLLFAYFVSVLSISHELFYGTPVSWRQVETQVLSFAGWWNLLVSLPLFHFLLFRWIWRWIVWCVFLRRLSLLNLRLISTHPDSVGGLGILAESIYALSPIVFAVSALLSSVWLERAIYGGGEVSEFHHLFIVFLVMTILISTVPLTIFTGSLMQVKLRGLHDYGVLANQHSLFFDEKWIRQAENNMGSVLGTPDISSLADLSTDYQTVQHMKFFPFGLQHLAMLAAAACVPMIPLLLIEVPVSELVLTIARALL